MSNKNIVPFFVKNFPSDFFKRKEVNQMNIKKFAITVGAAGIMLASATPALAHSNHSNSSDPNYTTVANNGSINNSVGLTSNTGHNSVSGRRGSITTGYADASSMLTNMLVTSIADCGCVSSSSSNNRLTLTLTNNGSINNSVDVTSNTGHNSVTGRRGSITTMDAAAGSAISNTINTSVGGSL